MIDFTGEFDRESRKQPTSRICSQYESEVAQREESGDEFRGWAHVKLESITGGTKPRSREWQSEEVRKPRGYQDYEHAVERSRIHPKTVKYEGEWQENWMIPEDQATEIHEAAPIINRVHGLCEECDPGIR